MIKTKFTSLVRFNLLREEDGSGIRRYSKAIWFLQSEFLKNSMIKSWSLKLQLMNYIMSRILLRKAAAKGGFFSESAMCFSNLQKNIFQKTILDLKFKFPAHFSILLLAGNLNFKFRIVFWNIFFWRFEKHIALSEKKPSLIQVRKFK